MLNVVCGTHCKIFKETIVHVCIDYVSNKSLNLLVYDSELDDVKA